MTVVDGLWIAAVLAADANLEIALGFTTLVESHLNELANTGLNPSSGTGPLGGCRVRGNQARRC